MKKSYDENIIKVFNWSKVLDPKTTNPFEPYRDEGGDKTCSIFLPLINKTVNGYGKNELERIKDLSNKACKEIDDYLSIHPECEIKTKFSLSTHDIIYDEEIDEIIITLNENERFNRESNIDEQKPVQKREFLKNFFNEYKTKFSNDDGLFIQMLSRNIFPDTMSDREVHTYLIDAVLALFDDDAREIGVHQDEDDILVTARILLEPSKIVSWRKQ